VISSLSELKILVLLGLDRMVLQERDICESSGMHLDSIESVFEHPSLPKYLRNTVEHQETSEGR